MIEVTDYTLEGWQDSRQAHQRARSYCEQLERGQILYFRDSMLLASDTARAVLTLLPPEVLAHKNISYSPSTGRIAGIRKAAPNESVCAALKEYSEAAIRFCAGLLAPYANSWLIELCSFRPMEERNRQLSRRERNDLLHIDAFPSRPGNGARILRMFTNIHPARSRAWLTSDALPTLGCDADFQAMMRAAIGKAESVAERTAATIIHVGKRAGLGIPEPSPYDRVMLHLHDQMKRDEVFQARCLKYRHEFEPGASWLVFTDTVPHAVLEGQFALEQSFFVPRTALVAPEAAPISIVEAAAGHPMSR